MSRLWLLLIALGVFLSVISPTALARDLKKRYPEFAARKDSLGAITLLVESAVLSDVDGDVKRVEISDSRTFANLAAQTFLEGLTAKGQHVDRAVVASIGSLLNPAVNYDLRPAGQNTAGADTSGLARAPFYLDSAFTDRPALSASWGELCRRLLGYERKETPDFLSEPIQLADSLGAKVIAVVIIYNWRVPTGKQFRQGLLTTVLSGGMVTAHKVSVARTEFALVDGRSGEILWADANYSAENLSEKAICEFAATSTKALP
ncbi:MAG TPA: hypothetical protein VIU29_06905 [Candidatus Deferrimicrobiaceae bacterium]